MKSAIELLKLVAFLLALQWLCSCNGDENRIRLLQQYEDSIIIAKIKITEINLRGDSIRIEYNRNYPITAFEKTPAALIARKEWEAKEQAAYKKMLVDERKYNMATMTDKIKLDIAIAKYKSTIDSLKLLLKLQ